MRIKVFETATRAYNILLGLDSYLNNCELSKVHIRLIQMRASQMNKCAHCLNLHIKEALKEGEKETRIRMLALWESTGSLFTLEERVVLKMTEEITDIQKNGLSDETYNQAIGIFTPEYVGLLIMAVVSINSFNRIAISTKLEESDTF